MSTQDYRRVLAKHRQHGFALDTEVLVLLWVGSFDRSLVGRFKRLNKYTAEDCDLLRHLIEGCPRLITTPNVLTEAVGWTRYLKGAVGREIQAEIARVIPGFHERTFDSASVASDPAFPRIGLADGTLLALARQQVLVLTDDLTLYHQIVREDLAAINFTHVRRWAYRWGD